MHSRATTFVKLLQTALTNCTFRVESCQLAQEIDGDDPTQCLAAATASCGAYATKIPSYKAAAVAKGRVYPHVPGRHAPGLRAPFIRASP